MILRYLPFATALVLAGLAAPGLAADAPTVSGEFALGESTLAPGHVTALRGRDSKDPRKEGTVVFLTKVAMDQVSLTGQRDAYVLAINDPALEGQDYLTVSLSPDGEVSANARLGGVQYIDGSGTVMGQPGSLKAECPVNSAARVECHVWTSKPVEVEAGKRWTLDLRFAAPVIARLGGKSLPADGGEPGKALRAFVEALQGDSLEAIFQLMSADRVAQHNADYNTPEENLASLKDIWSARLAGEVRITGGEQAGEERAFVQAEGELYPGVNMLFEIDMTRRDGRWVVNDGGSVGMLD